MKRLTALLLLAFCCRICPAFPYLVEWKLIGKVVLYYTSDEAWKDMEFFISSQTGGSVRLGLTKLNRFNRKGTVYLDGTVETKSEDTAKMFDGLFVSLLQENSAHDIPFEKERREKCVKNLKLDGFAEIEVLEGGEEHLDFMVPGTAFRQLCRRKYLNMIVKVFNTEGKIIFFDFVNTWFTDKKYYDVKESIQFDTAVVNWVQLEHEQAYRYNYFGYSDVSIWDTVETSTTGTGEVGAR
ncbi:MAG: hypothetical protein PHQ23_13990 [Candidatus Wallbacteria bacterium]|nr:hypothetical protein [Candidatus Wallbacteria bacterium]